MDKNKWAPTVVAVIVVISAVAGASYYCGFQSGLDQTKNIVIEGITGGETPEEIGADFSVFWQVWDKLKKEHIKGKDTDEQSLVYGAIKGLTEALNDPNTLFYSPEDYKKFNEDINGSFGGIGAEIGILDGNLIIIAPLKDTPAEEAGLKAKDKILKVDDTLTNNLTVEEAVKIIRGEIGTKVTLNILRDGWEKSKDIEIIRDTIQIPTVEWTSKGDGIVHLQLYNFNANTDFAFYQAMIDILFNRETRGLVLDLRNNPGGYLNVATNLSGWFLEKGSVVTKERFADGTERILKANGNEALKDMPMVILINGGSASASEILAGAIRYHRNVKLIGEQSFGKGTVQELQELRDDSALKITVANWLLPDDSLIQDNGLKPDIEIGLTEEDIEEERDPQLEKAIEILKEEIPSYKFNILEVEYNLGE